MSKLDDVRLRFPQLAVGDNTFRYDAESGIDNIEMTIYHNPATLGV